jgi:magnesium transporter
MATKATDLLIRSLVDRHPEDAARILEGIDAAGCLLAQIEPERVRKLLEDLPVRQAKAILARMDGALRDSALVGMSERPARHIRDLLRYPPGTAGAMMAGQVTSVMLDWTVRETIAALRRAPRTTLYSLFVRDRAGKLVGVLNTRELLLGAPQDLIEPMVRRDPVTISAMASPVDVARVIEKTRFPVLPVVDSEGHLLGVVEHDEVLDAVREEAFAELQKMVGAGADERALAPVSTVVRKRLPWLYVNLATGFVAAAVVGLFKDSIAKVTALALANDTAVALVKAGAAVAWDDRLGLGLIIGLAMVVNMGVGGLAGASSPLMLQTLGRHPAQSSSIFMTTVTDVVGFAAFLGFAVLFMPLMGV